MWQTKSPNEDENFRLIHERTLVGSRRWLCLCGLASLASIGLAAMQFPNLHASSTRRYKGDPSAAAGQHRAWLIGEMGSWIARREDSLASVARQSGLGYTEMLAANPNVDPWLPKPGTRIVLPTSHLVPGFRGPGLFVNLAQQRLYVIPSLDAEIISFPIGIGRAGWETPVGRTEVFQRREHPAWRVPASIRAESPGLPEIVPPGDENPLGTHAIDLGWPGFVIHGTNHPTGIGRRVSHGCIRLYPEDIIRLFELVYIGMPVTIIDVPIIVGWVGTQLYIEVHPTQRQSDELEVFGMVVASEGQYALDDLLCAAGQYAEKINWQRLTQIILDSEGIPIVITER